MGLGDVPVTELRGLVVVQAQVDPQADLAAGECLGEVEIGRSVVGRVAPEDDERVDGTGVDVAAQLAQRADLIGRAFINARQVLDGLAHVAQRMVDQVGQRVNLLRLRVARDHQAPSAGALQVAHHRIDPFVVLGEPIRKRDLDRRGRPADTNRTGDGPDDRGYVLRRNGQPVIGRGAGDGRRALDGVQPVHGNRGRGVIRPATEDIIARRLLRLATRGEGPRILEPARSPRQKIGVESDDHIGLVQMIDRLHLFAERLPAAGVNGVTCDGLIGMPLRLRELLLQPPELVGQRGRGDRLGQDPQAGALGPRLLLAKRQQEGLEPVPGFDPAVTRHHLRAIRVVEREYRGLSESVGGAQAGRMIGVPFNLGGPSHLALDQDAAGKPIHRDRRAEEQRFTRNDLLGGFHVRHDRLGGLNRAAAQAPQGQRGRHQSQELPAAGGVELQRHQI